jgi:predicted acetyltransferase
MTKTVSTKAANTSQHLIAAAQDLSAQVGRLRFAEPVTHIYNPLEYAWLAHEDYLRRNGQGRKQVVFLGMNPGPFGMTQTGVPFGEVAMVRDWLKISQPVCQPAGAHPKRPVQGFDCPRSEVSGRRLWGLFAERYAAPEDFFADHFVTNYCPLVFCGWKKPHAGQAPASGTGTAVCGVRRTFVPGGGNSQTGVADWRGRLCLGARGGGGGQGEGQTRTHFASQSGQSRRQSRLGAGGNQATNRVGDLELTMQFQPATQADCALLAEFNHQLIRDEGHRNPMTVAELEERLRGWLTSEYAAGLFTIGGETVAYVLYRETPHEIYLRHLFVVRHRRRQGIGRGAMEILGSKIWPAHKRRTVEVLTQNAAAVAFWRSVGYQDYSLKLEMPPK